MMKQMNKKNKSLLKYVIILCVIVGVVFVANEAGKPHSVISESSQKISFFEGKNLSETPNETGFPNQPQEQISKPIEKLLEEAKGNLEELKITPINDTTYATKSLSGDLIVFGEEIHSPPQPYVKLNKWDGEVNLKINVPQVMGGKKEMNQNKLKWVSDDYDADFYTKQPEQITETDSKGNQRSFNINDDGGVEFDLVIKKKPESNVFEFPIETENLEFYYQPPLTAERAVGQKQGHWTVGSVTATEVRATDGTLIEYRPENVVGSYAVYHKEKQGDYTALGGKNYRAGKAFHIYRPQATDASGNEQWADLVIDAVAGTLTISLPQVWLDAAAYPVVIDPDFGYTGTGVSTTSADPSSLALQRQHLSEIGTAVSVSVYALYNWNSETHWRAAIYTADDPHILEAYTNESAGHLPAAYAWSTINFAGSPSQMAHADHYLALGVSSDVTIRVDSPGSAMETAHYHTHAYGAFDASVADSFFTDAGWGADQKSFYVTYETPAGGDTVAPGVVANSPASGNITGDSTPDFNFTYTDETNATGSCTLYINTTMAGTNSSVANNTATTLTSNITLGSATYNWTINCSDGTNTNVTAVRNITISAVWADTSLDKCMNITITNSGAETLTNFPAYINLTYDSDMLPDFTDIRFYDAGCSNGGTAMDYEIENYTASSRAHIWARIPSLPSTGKVISVYYKNNTAVTSGQNPAGVWDSSYIAVYHMQKINATDSTSNQLNCTARTTTVMTVNNSGPVDGLIEFDGTNNIDSLNCSNNTLFNPSNMTIEAWVKVKGNQPSGYCDVIVQKPGQYLMYQTPTTTEITLVVYANDSSHITYAFASGSGLNNNTWYYLAATVNPSVRALYLNGNITTLDDENPFTPLNITPNLFSIGGDPLAGFYEFNGSIDEVRISSITRSANWINQTYLMINSYGSYVSFGSEESSSVNYTLNINNIQANPQIALNRTSINISANITTNIGSIDEAIIRINYPNGTSAANYTMTNTGGSNYWNTSTTSNFNVPGLYNYTIYANNTIGTSTTSSTYNFTPIINLTEPATITIDGTTTDWDSITSLDDDSSDTLYESITSTTLSLGARSTCGMLSNGSAYCWGRGIEGELGDGNSDAHNTTSPTPISLAPNNWSMISTGSYYHSCGILYNNSAYCWGLGSEGELGDGSATWHIAYTPNPLNTSINNFTKITTGYSHSCAIAPNGSGYCWGQGEKGRLGDRDNSSHTVPNPKPIDFSPNNWTELVAGEVITCGIAPNGSGYCWGDGISGRLGDGNVDGHNVGIPQPINISNNNWKNISAEADHTCGIHTNGTAYCWGYSVEGSLGIGGYYSGGSWGFPSVVNITPNNFTSIKAGTLYTCGIHANGSSYCWGMGDYGILGDGDASDHNKYNPSPVHVGTQSFTQIETSYGEHTCGIVSNGSTYCWGNGTWGRLGDGNESPQTVVTPTPVNYNYANPASFDIDITNYSLANSNTYLFARISVLGSIDFITPSKYYALYLSTNDATTGSDKTSGGGNLPFNYDYRIQLNNSACSIYDYNNATQGSCDYNNNSNTIELRANLTLINMTISSTANITLETGTTALESYDFAPDYNSFVRYTAAPSCVCPGAATNWNIDMSLHCNITTNCDITTGYLNFTNTGYVRFNATINVTSMQKPVSDQTVYIEKACYLIVN
jgi:alpha-tubulin suppressor-like RCC1 family protein